MLEWLKNSSPKIKNKQAEPKYALLLLVNNIIYFFKSLVVYKN